MERWNSLVTADVARRSIVALGGVYVGSSLGFPFLPIVDDASVELWAVLGVLVGGPGLALVYGGYRLPRTDIRPELYSTVTKWCFRGIAAGIAIMTPIVLASGDSEVVSNTLLLTALGSLAGFGAGRYDARARSRQLELEETIAELETSNERLEQYRQYTDAVLDAIDDVFYVVDQAGDLKRWNESLSEVTDHAAAEIDSMSAADFFDPDDREAAEAAVREGFETGSVSVQLDLRTKRGETVPFEFVGSTLEDPEGERVLAGVGRDITDRVERERKLEQSERRYRTLAQHFPNGAVGIYDSDLEYTLTEGAVLGESLPPADRLEGNRMPDIFPAGTVADLEPLFRAAIEDGETGSATAEFDGRDWRVWATPLRDADGEIFAGLSLAQDVTEQVERQRRLEESNERLEQFAHAASHDLQEPLRMVSTYLQLIERRYADRLDEDGREFIEFAVDGADRMREMIDGLLQYSRVETQGDPLQPVELDAVLSDVLDDLQVRIEETDADVSADPLPRVRGDAGQLRQVFQNLLDNAIEYSGDDPPGVHVAAERDGDWWEISVRDEGIGMNPDDADQVFEVFQSLHSQDEYDGTGIGLALCERIVERHGGDIRVESAVGAGATFSFTLPAAPDDHSAGGA